MKEMVTYEEIKQFAETIQQQWNNLDWSQINELESVPNKPGIYRLILKIERQIPDDYKVCSKDDATITGNLPAGIILSVGKTKTLRKRIKQHFGDNKYNNRLRKRLGNIGIKVKDFSSNNDKVQLQYCVIDNWWKRDLLEAYGRAITCAFFDLEIEH